MDTSKLLDSPIGSLTMLVILLAFQIGIFGTIPLVWGYFTWQPFNKVFSLRPAPRNVFFGAALIAIAMVLLAFPTLLLQKALHIFPPDPNALKEQTRMLLPMMRYWPILAVLTIPLAAAVTEEFLFRGVAQQSFLRKLPAWPTFWILSIVFALVHLDMSGLIFRALLGLLFAWMTWKSRSLYPAIFCHCFYDFIVFATSAIQLKTDGTEKILAMLDKPLFGYSTSVIVCSAIGGMALLGMGIKLCDNEFRRMDAIALYEARKEASQGQESATAL